MRTSAHLSFCAAVLLATACASCASSPAGGGGTGGSTGHAEATGGAFTGGQTGSGGGTGGADGAAAGGGVGTAAAGATGSGGATGGAAGSTTGGGGSGGGRAGAGGSGGAAVNGGGGGATDPRAAAAVLDAFQLLKPCFSAPGSCAGCTCDENASNILNSGMAPENQHITKKFGGDAGVMYDVKLRVVGVAERYWYDGGTLDSVSKVFYTGGLPTIHSAQAANTLTTQGGRVGVGSDAGPCKIHPTETDNKYPLTFTVPPEVKPADGCYNGFNTSR